MITIKKSATADTRTCDFANTSVETLLESSKQHIRDVQQAMEFLGEKLHDAATVHDADKLTDILWFHADFVTGFKNTGWWDNHRKINRHHLSQADGVPEDVNLLDVLANARWRTSSDSVIGYMLPLRAIPAITQSDTYSNLSLIHI